MRSRILVRAALAALATLTGIYLIAPVFFVVPTAFNDSPFLAFPPETWSLRWFGAYFADATWIASTLNSIKIGLLVTVLSSVLGTLAALAMVRGRYPVRAAVGGLVLAPILVPYVIVGLAVYAAFLRLGLTQTTLGFVLVHTALAVPFVVINVSSALYSYDRRLDLAAMNLGASPLTAFARVTLPIIAPSVAAGALFAFITSFDEVVTSIFLAGPDMTTLPVQMWSGVRVQIDPTVAAVSTLLLLITLSLFACAGLARALRNRRLNRG
ncbi:ABC transporter permease [Blastococcus mobilis]|uniref:Putative spermidine/putrescine transport system permease protein n=1 Tax=Blastococcus mobilis TaxID=1938746 RepID=A0A238YFJ0_9ACTN|nr:ABC transporter permease [Blastococcus mobilis]SNR69363.1 putative spermidine/putrescine transport system permease protein [Blastococcus mobilis]